MLTDPPSTPARAFDPADVLVVIPTLDEAETIELCLDSLLDADGFAQATRIVVADGGSGDATRRIVSDLAERRYRNLRLIDNPDRLQSAAVNRAVDLMGAMRGDGVLVRCDAHARYPAGYLRGIAGALAARPEAASVVTVLDAGGGSGFQRAAAWAVDTGLASGGSAHRGGRRSGWVDHGHHAGFRLDWFRRLGGYDPTFSHNEDAEYDLRLARAGGRIWLDADLRVDYAMRGGLPQLWRQYRSYGRGRARTWLKHRAGLRLRQQVPVLNLLLLLASVAAAPFAPAALLYPAFYAAALTGVSLAAIAALRDPSGAWAGPATGAIHLGWGSGFLQEAITGHGQRVGVQTR
ncbi:glycosyltransferase family 2 protein [Wenxinia saemankumensis]|uniref:Succinoglycan biosynthesis protein ExoA n=1 Tax=Wenxinia saemankumensis TaxID=1447782 RepID=A0A1M5ZYI6_9RHOB|nr:glycosyltransferase family 2 protein [Wenxinia saemankumensis]SHI29335.1 succinoglycan biosynthesis protein ExoA [Wenxinia saemankumensis]